MKTNHGIWKNSDALQKQIIFSKFDAWH